MAERGEHADAPAARCSDQWGQAGGECARMIMASVLAGVILWSIPRALVPPFLLGSVPRNDLKSGADDIPAEDSLFIVDGKSPTFLRLQESLACSRSRASRRNIRIKQRGRTRHGQEDHCG